MTNQDYPQFVAVWTQAFEVYDKSPSDGAVDLAFAALSRFTLEQVKRGLTGHINHPDQGQFFPKPADVVRQIEGDGKSRALVAWSNVMQAMERVGSYQSVCFDDPIVHAVVSDMGGWIALCVMSYDDLKYRGNEFAKRYEGYAGRGLTDYPTHLVGVVEAENRKDFPEHVSKPVLIGDPQKAEQVRLGGSGQRLRITGAQDSAEQFIKRIGEGVA